jgi:hypothetical protein
MSRNSGIIRLERKTTMEKFNTKFKHIIILGVKYLIKSATELCSIDDPKEVTHIYQFNWANIPADQVIYC